MKIYLHFYAAVQVFCFLTFGALVSQGQDVDIEWASSSVVSTKNDGVFYNCIGSNDKYFYARFISPLRKFNKPTGNLSAKIAAFDKQTLKPLPNKINVCGFGENKKTDKKYFSAVVTEKKVIIFTQEMTRRGNDILYASTYSSDLNLEKSNQKIFEGSLLGTGTQSAPFLITTQSNDGSFVLATEMIDDKGNVSVSLKIFDQDLNLTESPIIPLNVNKNNREGYIASYRLLSNGKLLVTYTKGEEAQVNGSKKKRYGYFVALIIVDIKTEKQESYEIKYEDKSLFNTYFMESPDGIDIVGFYNDEVRFTGESTQAVNGVFTTRINSNGQLQDFIFSPFEVSFIDQVTRTYMRARQLKKDIKKGEKGEADNEFINLKFMSIQSLEDGYLLVASRMRNFSVQTCYDKGGCVTSYYCTLKDIITMKIDRKGKMAWLQFSPRDFTFDGWDHYDVNVCSLGKDQYIITYVDESTNQGDWTFSVVNTSKGEMTEEHRNVNPADVERSEKKNVNRDGVFVKVDGTLYVINQQTSKNLWIFCCAGSASKTVRDYSKLFLGKVVRK